MKPNEPTFGADAYGLVWGYRFAAGQPARPITIEGAATFMAAPAQEVRDAFLWLHFSLSHVGTEPWLRQHVALPDGFYHRCAAQLARRASNRTAMRSWR